MSSPPTPGQMPLGAPSEAKSVVTPAKRTYPDQATSGRKKTKTTNNQTPPGPLPLGKAVGTKISPNGGASIASSPVSSVKSDTGPKTDRKGKGKSKAKSDVRVKSKTKRSHRVPGSDKLVPVWDLTQWGPRKRTKVSPKKIVQEKFDLWTVMAGSTPSLKQVKKVRELLNEKYKPQASRSFNAYDESLLYFVQFCKFVYRDGSLFLGYKNRYGEDMPIWFHVDEGGTNKSLSYYSSYRFGVWRPTPDQTRVDEWQYYLDLLLDVVFDEKKPNHNLEITYLTSIVVILRQYPVLQYDFGEDGLLTMVHPELLEQGAARYPFGLEDEDQDTDCEGYHTESEPDVPEHVDESEDEPEETQDTTSGAAVATVQQLVTTQPEPRNDLPVQPSTSGAPPSLDFDLLIQKVEQMDIDTPEETER